MALVLVIDDETAMRRMLRKLLEGAGHTVVEAYDGERGLHLFRETSPDLVITDIFMPNKEGVETIREMRELKPNVKILAVSGGNMGELDLLAIVSKLGATQVLSKPFREHELLVAVAKMMPGASPTPVA